MLPSGEMAAGPTPRAPIAPSKKLNERASFYVWTAVVLASWALRPGKTCAPGRLAGRPGAAGAPGTVPAAPAGPVLPG